MAGENRHLSGLLRDIYHLNLLTDSHADPWGTPLTKSAP